MTKYSVHLVTYNGAKYIPYLFASLREQATQDCELLIIDNASADNTVELIQKELINFPFLSRIIVNKQNKGFAGGHNRAFNETKSDFFVIINQDLVLEPNCLNKMFSFLESNTQAAAVAPRLMKWNFSVIPSEALAGEVEESRRQLANSLTNTIDSLGLKVFRSRQVVDIGEGEEWNNKPINQSTNKLNEVFGVSGALAGYRRSAINEIGYLFDESYIAYKEDVDLAYRLRSAGYKSFVLLDSVAYHNRTAGGVGAQKLVPTLQNDVASAQNKTSQSFYVKYHSYKNHLITLIKNEYWQNYLLDLPWIKWYELKKFVYFLIFDRKVLGGLKEIIKMRKELKFKRKEINKQRKVNYKEIRKWWSK